jgi:hypothetical protein
MPINNTPKEFPKPSAGNLVNQTKLLPYPARREWRPPGSRSRRQRRSAASASFSGYLS